MKIAIATDGNMVSGHFGHCEGFTIYDIDGDKISNETFVENPGHRPGFLPVFLKKKDVDVIIAGGMGGTAQQLFIENGIKVIVGAQGNCDDVINSYVKGELKSTGTVCEEHQHEGHCNE
jgi:predicted Fe-Mo cluster-binding NifX family protein